MKDMTKGNSLKLIIGFAVPMLIASIFQQLYALIDTLIVGRFLGAQALAGVGATGTLTFLLLTLALGMANGGGLIIAQCFGSRDLIKMRRIILATAWTMGLLTVLFSVIGYIGSPLFLRLLRVPDDCIGYGITYLKIIFAFTGGTMLFNFASSILRSTGDSRTPLYALVVASLANIALDLLLILGAGLGVRGAAIATVISQFVSGILCMGAIIRNRAAFGFDTDAGWLPDVASIRLVVTTSIPATFQSCMISIGGIFVQRLINSFGAATLAGYIAASKVDSLAIQVILSVGNALCVFTGQNIGSNHIDRVKTALKQSQLIMLASAVVIATCAYLFRFRVMGLFLNADTEPEAIVIGATYLSIMGVAYLICAIMQSYQNVIRGAGDVTVCMIAGLTELGGRILFAYLLSPLFGSTGIWIATPISWACGCIIPVIRYYSGKWEARRL